MARKRDRIFALVVALAFILTTVGVSVALIWQIVQEEKGKTNQPLNQNNNPNQSSTQTNNNPNKLEGKQMDGFEPIAKITELKAIDITPGTGKEVKATDTLTVDYTGAVAATGKIFQSSLDTGQPATFPLSGVIEGWKEGLVGMKEGGKRRLLIPAAKAYGSNPPQNSGIPVDADLVFDVTLHKIAE